MKIIFAIAAMLAQGPVIGSFEEPTKFKTEAECVAYGKAMSPRVADWVRGKLGAEWDLPVSVHFRCETDGDPT